MDYITTTCYVTNELMGRYTKKTRIMDQYHGSISQDTANKKEEG